LKATINEMEKLLISKVVVGEPVESGGTTVVPLLSVSFGFGAEQDQERTSLQELGAVPLVDSR